MATLASTGLTLMDWARRTDNDGKTAMIVDLLSQANEILDDMLWVEGNLETGFKTTVRTSLPQGTWRALNAGVANTKSTTAQLVVSAGNLEAYSLIDKDLADLNGNTAAFRLSEDRAFFEGLSQQMASQLFYGNATIAPAQFTGLTSNYNTVTLTNAQSAANVIDMGGTGSTNASMWLCGWSPDTTIGFFPKGKKAGLQHVDMGEWPVQDASGNTYQAYRSHFKWEAGLAVRDWRFNVRVANIDVTTLTGSQAPNLINALDRMLERPPRLNARASSTQTVNEQSGIVGTGDRAALYCNRVLRTWLRIQMHNKPNLLLTMESWEGKPVMSYCGVPFRTVDQLISTESRVV